MEIVSPITITEAMLTSNVAASTVPLHDPAISYTTGSEVRVVVDGLDRLYRWLPETASVAGVDTDPANNSVMTKSEMDEENGLVWLDLGSTNRHAMFDGRTLASTTNSDSIEIIIAPDELFDTIGIVNFNGQYLHITITDGTMGVLYDEDIDLVDLEDSFDFYSWCFNPPIRKQTIHLPDLPLSYDGQIAITLTEIGQTVSIGEIMAGMAKDIGQLLYGYGVGLRDYSRKTKDDAGIPSLKQGIHSNTGNFKIKLDRSRVTDVRRTLAALRARPILWIGVDDYTETIIYGYYLDFDATVNTARDAYCTINIEELS